MFLEEEVLALLFPLPFNFLVLFHIQVSQFIEFLLALVFRVDRVEDILPSLNPALMSFVFLVEELESFFLLSIEVYTLCCKSLKVLCSVVFYRLIHPLVYIFALLLNSMVLVHHKFAVLLKLALGQFGISIIVSFLSLNHISATILSPL